MLRFSLLALLLFTAFVGLGCAALVYAAPLVANITLFVVVLLLTSSLVTAVYAAPPLRVFAGGFALGGWVYFLLTSVPVMNIRPALATDDLSRELFVALGGDLRQEIKSLNQAWRNEEGDVLREDQRAMWDYLTRDGEVSHLLTIPWVQSKTPVRAFANISHSLCAVLLGFFGGGLALILIGRRKATVPK